MSAADPVDVPRRTRRHAHGSGYRSLIGLRFPHAAISPRATKYEDTSPRSAARGRVWIARTSPLYSSVAPRRSGFGKESESGRRAAARAAARDRRLPGTGRLDVPREARTGSAGTATDRPADGPSARGRRARGHHPRAGPGPEVDQMDHDSRTPCRATDVARRRLPARASPSAPGPARPRPVPSGSRSRPGTG